MYGAANPTFIEILAVNGRDGPFHRAEYADHVLTFEKTCDPTLAAAICERLVRHAFHTVKS